MNTPVTMDTLIEQNQVYKTSLGVSERCASSGYAPAFQDTLTGETHLSLYANGHRAPVHMLDGLPEQWVVKRDQNSRVVAVRATVVAGFVHDGIFYTRKEVATLVSMDNPQSEAG